MRPALAALVALAVALAAAPARGYVRTTTAAGHPYRWAQTCIPIDVYLGGLDGVAEADMRAAVSAAARAWSAQDNPCTDVELVVTFRDGAGPPAANDGHNVLGARPDGWCQAETNAGPPPGAACHAPSALAATTGSASASDGRLLDSDTQLNTLTFSWAALDANGQPSDRQDLQAAVTHELGHLLGFDHPCWSGVGARALDDRGDPVPDCYGAPAALAQETMFPSADPGDISKRVLSADARRGLCEVYPSTGSAAPPAAPAACPAPAPAGCAVAGDAAPLAATPVAALALALGLVMFRRSRNG